MFNLREYKLQQSMTMKLVFIMALLAASIGSSAQSNKHQYGNYSGSITRVVSSEYLITFPEEYTDESRELFPLLVFLHGSGERGNDTELLKVHGPLKQIDQGKKFPFIILAPQCPLNQDFDTETVFAVIEDVVNKHKVDRDRIYVTGLSMGGAATWNLAMAYPGYFAAIAPVCGYVNRNFPARAGEIKDLAAWVFHGANDDVVPIHLEAKMVSALREQGSKVKFTIYPTGNHDAWTETYNNEDLYTWLLEQRRDQVQPDI
jgi:predicted peptidase